MTNLCAPQLEKKRGLGIWGASMLCLAAASPSDAAPTQHRFAVVWNLAPGRALEAAKSVRTNESVTQVRLLPAALYLNDAPVYDDHDRLVVPADSELAQARNSAGWVVGCVISAYRIKARFTERFTARERNTCLIDTDKDGRFDHYSLYKSAFLTLGAMGKLRHHGGLKPASYRTAKIDSSADSPTLLLNLTSFDARAATFSFCIRGFLESLSRRKTDCLTPGFTVPLGSPVNILEVDGAVFEVKAGPTNGLHVEMKKQFEAGPILISNWMTGL